MIKISETLTSFFKEKNITAISKITKAPKTSTPSTEVKTAKTPEVKVTTSKKSKAPKTLTPKTAKVDDVIQKEYSKKFPDDKTLINSWSNWYAEGHYDFLFRSGYCDDEDNGEKAKFLYALIKKHLQKSLTSNCNYINTLANLINQNKNEKIKQRRFKIGDIVGICSDCMAEFKITGFKGNNNYIGTCLTLHHPNPEKSTLKINNKYIIKDSQIIVKLNL